MKYRSDIDGLRALAVLPVVFFHVGWGFPGGFVGVDVFFVISGFLISGILLHDLESAQFSILGFYDRRVRRILPALAFMLIGVIFAAWWLFLPYEFEKLGKHLTDVSTFLSNYWLENRAGNYWSPRAEELPLLHTWSLAVEEQFYIFMPILLWGVFRYFRKYLAFVLSSLFFASLVHAIYTTKVDPSAAFYLLPSRAWELLLGALVCLIAHRITDVRMASLREILGAAGLLMLAFSFFYISGDLPFPGYAALVPTVGTALLILANSGTITRSGRLLCWPPLVFIGLISYSLYLWHWPIIVFAKAWRHPHPLTNLDEILIVLGSTLIAVVSWYWVEQPFRGKHFRNMPRRVVLVGLTVLLFFVAVSLVIRKTDGYPDRFEGRIEGELLNAVRTDVLDRDGSGRFQVGPLFDSGGLKQDTAPEIKPTFVMIGDSHGAMFAPVVAEVLSNSAVPSAFFTHDGKTPFFGQDIDGNDAITGFVDEWRPETIVVVLRLDGLWRTNPETELPDEAAIDEFVGKLRWLSERTCQLWVSLQIPRISDENTRAARIIFNSAARNGGVLPEIRERTEDRQARVRTLELLKSLEVPNLKILDLSEPYFARDSIVYHNNGLLYYRDEDHVNLRGARLTKDLFKKASQACYYSSELMELDTD